MILSTFAMLLNYHHYLFPNFLLTTNRSSGSIEQERHHLFLASLTPYSSSSLSVSCPPFLPPSSFSGFFVSVISFVHCLVGTFWILSLTHVSFYYIHFFWRINLNPSWSFNGHPCSDLFPGSFDLISYLSLATHQCCQQFYSCVLHYFYVFALYYSLFFI